MAVQIIDRDEPLAVKRRVYFKLVDASDGLTPESGESGGQPELSVNGINYVNTAGTLVAISAGVNGSYYVELILSEVSVESKLLIRYKSANTVEYEDVILIQNPFQTAINDLKSIVTAMQRKINYIEWSLRQDVEEQEELTVV